MNQVLHIFRKDLRRHWPDILAALTLLIVFVAEQPRTWTEQPLQGHLLNTLVDSLPLLMILAWAFFVVRLVQGESLVGDRQFWITRPYEWHKLLGAKLLSILIFIHLPLFISQLALLKIAHFPVASSVPGLLYVHLLFFFAVVLPSITIGSITSGVGQASLVLLTVFLLVLGMVWLSTVIPDMDFSSDATDIWQGVIYLCACVAVILVQYIYRKTLLSRLTIGGAVVLLFLVIALAPYGKLNGRDFPLATKQHPQPARFSLDRGLSFSHAEGHQLNFFGDQVELEFPFQVEGLADQTIIQIRAIKLDLDSPNGDSWSSHWHSLYHSVSPGRTRDWPAISIKRAVFDRFNNGPVRAHVSLGFNIFRLGSGTQVSLAGNRLSLPGGARCTNESTPGWMKCFASLKHSVPLFVVSELPSASCPGSRAADTESWSAAPAIFADLRSDSTPSLEFSPIQQFNISLGRSYAYEDQEARVSICPGTPLLVFKPEFLYSVRNEIDLGDVTLLNYVPTYPRNIVPPMRRRAPGTAADKLSWDLPHGFNPRVFIAQR